ncbi:MAG: hypothetical protein AB1898_25265 [Acidobacteriota bacterium]
MARIIRFLVLALAVVAFVSLRLNAVGPQFWTTSTFSDFSKGEFKDLSLSRDGFLSLSPKFDSVFDTDQALIWSAVYDSKTKSLFVGTGHDGKVFKIDDQGTSSLFFDAAELDVLAMALDAQQTLFVATSPDGKIYKVGSDGKAAVFFDPEEKFIWDMAFDSKGTLYAATGSKGKIYKIDKGGKGEPLYESRQTNIMCLLIDANDQVIAGSEPDGYVYRIAPDGKAFVLYDSEMREIHGLRRDSEGNIFAIALQGTGAVPFPEPKSAPVETASSDSVSVTVSVSAVGDKRPSDDIPAVKAASPRSARSGNKSVVLKILKDGRVEKLWESDSETIYGLHLHGNGKILFSTGTKGRIYSLDGDRKVSLLIEATEEQTTRLIPAGQDVIACTSNLAKVYRLGERYSARGNFDSDVKDTQSVSAWGTLDWRASVPEGTAIKLYTRTGNTKVPDNTWSDWSKAYTRADGETIQSPKARYIQYRVVMTTNGDKTPLLQQVRIPFLPQNLAPEVKSISILPPGVAYQRLPGVSPQRSQTSMVEQAAAEASGASDAIQQTAVTIPPRRVYQKGAQSFSWEAEDPNGDDLLYAIHFRGESEVEWKVLKKDLDEKFLTVESDSLPDGKYFIKVVATDSPSNPRLLARLGELVSPVFLIDNTPPTVQAIKPTVQGNEAIIRFKATDTVSALRKAELSVDGGDWEVVFSVDGIVDSKEEEFDAKAGGLATGEHTLALRVYDSTGNVGIGKAVFKIK